MNRQFIIGLVALLVINGGLSAQKREFLDTEELLIEVSETQQRRKV